MPKGASGPGGVEALLRQFRESLEESNQVLLAEVRGEMRQIEARLQGLEGEIRVARMETQSLRGELERLRGEPPARAEVAAAEAPDAERSAEAEQTLEELRERHKDIWQLQEAGESVAEVAKRTNRPQGEVELIMRLMRSRGAPAPGPGR